MNFWKRHCASLRPGGKRQEDIQMEKNLSPKLEERYKTFCRSAKWTLLPPFPKEILIEVANICNHTCRFCAYRLMTRPKAIMDFERYSRILADAYVAGARQVGLYAGAEPFTVKRLDRYVAKVKQIGYEYIYCTTNGSLATPGLLKSVIDAGLDSIKFSVNGGDRETYSRIHGRDHFDRVIENIHFVAEYRKTLGRPFRLYSSFVEIAENEASYPAMKGVVGPLVDDIFHVKAANVSGQNPDLPTIRYEGHCPQPFNRITVSQEGFLRLCCNDYQNMLAIEDLNRVSIREAWHGERMVDMRRRHLENRLEGTLCYNCLTGKNVRVYPVNTLLSNLEMVSTLPIIDEE